MPSGIILLHVHNFINPQAMTLSRNGPCRFSIVCDNICIPVLPGKPSLDKRHLQIGSVSSSNASFSYFIQQLNVDGPDVASHQLVLKVLAWHQMMSARHPVQLSETRRHCMFGKDKPNWLQVTGGQNTYIKRCQQTTGKKSYDSNCMLSLGAHLHVLHNR